MLYGLTDAITLGLIPRFSWRDQAGTGDGAYLTQFGFLSDAYVTVAGRPLRLRLDLSCGMSRSVGVKDRSVYGTPDGFVGQIRPGPIYDATGAFEYSLSTRWAVALDASYDRGDKTRIDGVDVQTVSEIGQSADLVPALEYNFAADTGLIFGVQLPVWQQNKARFMMPMAALNCVF